MNTDKLKERYITLATKLGIEYYPPNSVEEIKEFEIQNNIKLDQNFIDLYTQITGGGFGLDYGLAPLKRHGKIFGEIYKVEIIVPVDKVNLGNQLVLFTSIGCGAFIAMINDGQNKGNVILYEILHGEKFEKLVSFEFNILLWLIISLQIWESNLQLINSYMTVLLTRYGPMTYLYLDDK